MTEVEWLTSSDPTAMLFWAMASGSMRSDPPREWIPSERKLRLFNCAVCRTFWDQLNERSRKAVEIGEQMADGVASKGDECVYSAFSDSWQMERWKDVSRRSKEELWFGDWCISKDVLKIARHKYAERDWSAMPKLADACEESGCRPSCLLRHLREGESYWVCCCGAPLNGSHDHNSCGPPIEEKVEHVLGCWVLDCLLGKS